jgi:hypothetical protein
MGLFDTVTCKYKEMPKEHQELVYQTKSLYSALDKYLIDEEGKLFIEQFEIITKKNPDYDPDKFLSFEEIQEKVNKEWIERPITDTIVFYASDGVWIEYSAAYVKGELVHFEQIESS